MRRHWEDRVEPLLRAAAPRVVCEIGADAGAQTECLLDLCVELDAVAHVIDPAPRFDVEAWAARYGPRLRFHRARSLEVLAGIANLDAVLVDGDHNWFTVFHELQLIDAESDCAPPLVLLHDVGWPYARRDMYYVPEDVPAEYRQEHARQPLHPDEAGAAELGLNAHLENALREGGARNGVLTAVEDFMHASARPWRLVTLAPFHGFGVLVTPDRAPEGSPLDAAIRSLTSEEALGAQVSELERARVIAEIALARWRAAAEAGAARPRAEELSRMASELPELHAQLLDLRHELAVERRRRERLELILRRLGSASTGRS